MTDDPNRSRRKFLAAIGAVGSASMAGCSSTNDLFQQGPQYVDPQVNFKVTVQLAPNEARSSPYIAVFSDDIMGGESLSENIPSIFQGKQLRIHSPESGEGWSTGSFLFTSTGDATYTSNSKKTVWLTDRGLDRLDASPGDEVTVRPYATANVYSGRDDTEDNNGIIEQWVDGSSSNIFISPHSGDIYPYTARQAFRGSSEVGTSVWALLGYHRTSFAAKRRWFVPPEFFKLRSFVGLSRVGSGFDRAVSFTGHRKTSLPDIIIGGLAPEEDKQMIYDRLDELFHGSNEDSDNEGNSDGIDNDIDIEIQERGEYAAADPENICNKLTIEYSGGIQITQSERAREKYWKEISDEVVAITEEHF